MPLGMFISAVRSASDRAGVFEHDGSTGYLYLWDMSRAGEKGIVGAVHVLSGRPDFLEREVEVRWNRDQDAVGVFIRGKLWAAFAGDVGVGGDYRPNAQPEIPSAVRESF